MKVPVGYIKSQLVGSPYFKLMFLCLITLSIFHVTTVSWILWYYIFENSSVSGFFKFSVEGDNMYQYVDFVIL